MVSKKQTYRIELTPAASRDLKAIAKQDRRLLVQISKAIDDLKFHPYPPQSQKLQAEEDNIYRLRVKDFRIIYQVQSQLIMITIVRVGHRRQIYRHL